MRSMNAMLNVERASEVAAEYRTAYLQLQAVDQKLTETLILLENDRRLAERRYQAARKAFVELALGEDDGFLAEEEAD